MRKTGLKSGHNVIFYDPIFWLFFFHRKKELKKEKHRCVQVYPFPCFCRLFFSHFPSPSFLSPPFLSPFYYRQNKFWIWCLVTYRVESNRRGKEERGREAGKAPIARHPLSRLLNSTCTDSRGGRP